MPVKGESRERPKPGRRNVILTEISRLICLPDGNIGAARERVARDPFLEAHIRWFALLCESVCVN
jgi:hypothetical protein